VAYDKHGQRAEVLYVPTEIETLWKQASKVSFTIFLLFCCALSLLLTVAIVVSTKLARRGYRPLSAED
jgi:NADH:ubiquinone oxidoreductase subunit 6 (subunit J)